MKIVIHIPIYSSSIVYIVNETPYQAIKMLNRKMKTEEILQSLNNQKE
jgi:hypothetical protein